MKDQKISTTLGTVILIIISATIGGFVLLCFENYPVVSDINSLLAPTIAAQFEKKVIAKIDKNAKKEFSVVALAMGLDCEKDSDAKRICVDGTRDDLFDELCDIDSSCKKERDINGWARSEQSKYFIKDNTVYAEDVSNGNERKIIKIEGADSSSFRVLGQCMHTEVYAIDKNYVYVGSERLGDVDVSSFEYLGLFAAGSDMSSGGSIARDKNHIYFYCGKAADYVDVGTFELVGSGYSKDKDYVYYFGARTNIDPDSVAVKSYTDNDFKGNFATDNNNIYFQVNRISGVDVHLCKIDSLKECLPNTWKENLVDISKEFDFSKTISDDQSDWYTYKNNDYGIYFKYPKSWDMIVEKKDLGAERVRFSLDNAYLFNINLTNWRKFVIEEGSPSTFWFGLAKGQWKYFVDNRDDIVSGACSSEDIKNADGSAAGVMPRECFIDKGKKYIKVKTESNMCFYGNENEICISSNENNFSQLESIIATMEIEGY